MTWLKYKLAFIVITQVQTIHKNENSLYSNVASLLSPL